MSGDPRGTIPGYEGSVGPGPGAYGKPHVYARDTCSGSGNCVCGRWLHHGIHTEAAPGVPIPGRVRDDGSVTMAVWSTEAGVWDYDIVNSRTPGSRFTSQRLTRLEALNEAIDVLCEITGRQP